MDAISIKLKKLYVQSSKHSNYQVLSKKLKNIINDDEIIVKSRNEQERLAFILENIDVKDKTILDIGGNCGYFTFELIDKGALNVCIFEGNQIHSEFVETAAKALQISDKINVQNKYFQFDFTGEQKYDITLLLNVLHHLGDDYGDNRISMDEAKREMLKQLNSVANYSDLIIFQLGFNWKGDRSCCLFENGTKTEMIDFISTGTKDYWEIIKIGIAENVLGKIKYREINAHNVERHDIIGEFLNRPIFLMKSKRINV